MDSIATSLGPPNCSIEEYINAIEKILQLKNLKIICGAHGKPVTNPKEKKQRTEKNFRIAKKEFGMKTLKKALNELLEDYGDEIRASRKRIQKSKKIHSV